MKGFHRLSSSLCSRKGLSANAKLGFAYLGSRLRLGLAWPTLTELCEDLGVARATAVRLLRELESAGMVTRCERSFELHEGGSGSEPPVGLDSEPIGGSETEPSAVQNLDSVGSGSEPIAVQNLNSSPSYAENSEHSERALRARARGRPSSSIDCPDPLGEFETVSSADLPWRAWVAVSRGRSIAPTGADRRRDFRHVEDLERRILELAPQVAEARGLDLGAAAKLLTLTAMRRFGEAFDAERAPDAFGRPKLEWRLGWVVSRWAELTQGAIPAKAATPSAVGVPATLAVWREWVRASHARGSAPSDRDRLDASQDLATLDRRIGEHAAHLAAARGVALDEAAAELAREVVERFLVAFRAERTPDAKGPPRLEWSPASLLAALPALLPQTQADPASRPKAAQTAA